MDNLKQDQALSSSADFSHNRVNAPRGAWMKTGRSGESLPARWRAFRLLASPSPSPAITIALMSHSVSSSLERLRALHRPPRD